MACWMTRSMYTRPIPRLSTKQRHRSVHAEDVVAECYYELHQTHVGATAKNRQWVWMWQLEIFLVAPFWHGRPKVSEFCACSCCLLLGLLFIFDLITLSQQLLSQSLCLFWWYITRGRDNFCHLRSADACTGFLVYMCACLCRKVLMTFQCNSGSKSYWQHVSLVFWLKFLFIMYIS